MDNEIQISARASNGTVCVQWDENSFPAEALAKAQELIAGHFSNAQKRGLRKSNRDYSSAVNEGDDYAEFLSHYKGWVDRSDATAVSTGRPRQHATRWYAFLSTWQDADIVEAAVANCLAEGADRVYLLDNASTDRSAELGAGAGAILAQSYKTAFFQDVHRIRLLNSIMRDITESEGHHELWWSCHDCDEMLRGPGRLTVRQYLSQLPEDVNMVGANSFDHYPTEAVSNVPGKHPAQFQPYGWLRSNPDRAFCTHGHWKHPLYRYKHGVYDAIQLRGLHNALSHPRRGPSVEPSETLLLHHFMYRNEQDTRKRLTMLCGPDPRLNGQARSKPDDEMIQGEGAMTRFQNIDRVYAKDWVNARMPHIQAWPEYQKKGVPAMHWTDWFDAVDYLPRV